MSQQEYDKDLRSVQQARRLLEQCRTAQRQFASASAAQVDAICQAMSEAAFQEAERLGRMAHEETGYGNPDHKTVKNQHAAKAVWESIRTVQTVGVIARDEARKLLTIAEPMGVAAALTPSTNPTSTAIFKTLIAVKGRNGIVISPHPSAARCTLEAVRIVAAAAERAGAPKGLIACLEEPTLQATQEILRHYAVTVILATGGGPMVRAAHSTGKPAYGVGPGNVPAWVDRSADVPKAARDLVRSKSFDCSLICATEQTVVADQAIAQDLRRHMEQAGAYWVDEAQAARLGELLFRPDGGMNTRSVGQSAQALAQAIGLSVPATVKVLVAPLGGVGAQHPLSREKLTSVLGFITVPDARAGLENCVSILKFGGDGHTAVIHSQDEKQVEEMALRLPAFRIVVNSMSTLGSVGHTCGFAPSFTLGTGGIGGAISGDNITVTHLINTKRVGWELVPWTPADGQGDGRSGSVTPQGGGAQDIDAIVRGVMDRLRAADASRSLTR
ncbi:aldehyde dehydrogenase family protein [Castellaniella sp. S9]|uniref:aldehyde dehydrogenase family protein n=1 Tax=Castellaniella sp. S9 TaxID=2993652 RepID=UPI0022B5B9EC|nr:aldehyde dehydrogenase family protein [Castellaniella sp. S9]